MPIALERKLTIARLREVLDYDPMTGIFTWKIRLSRGTPVGAAAGCIEKRTSYRIISIDGKNYSAATLAWLHYYGEWPAKYLLFQNKDKTDLRIENLGYKYPVITPEVIEERKLRKRLIHRKWRAEKPDLYRDRDLQRAFGIDMVRYKEMHDEQSGVCAICGNPEIVKRNGKVRWLAVDHCHTSNKVRGLLCGKCNPMIGYSQDDPTILDKAAAYLRRHAAGDGGLTFGKIIFNPTGRPLSELQEIISD